MNPPFFLQRKFNKEYSRDVFDYDFVKRAFAMLDFGGVLVAITGMKWKENKDIQDFYKEYNFEIKEKKGVKWTGAEVKKGGEVASLNITFLYVKKTVENPQLDNRLLDEGNELFLKPGEQPLENFTEKTDIDDINTSYNEDQLLKDYLEITEAYRGGFEKYPTFTCNTWVSAYLYNYILNKNKNDCSVVPIIQNQDRDKSQNSSLYVGHNYMYKRPKKGKFYINQVDNLEALKSKENLENLKKLWFNTGQGNSKYTKRRIST